MYRNPKFKHLGNPFFQLTKTYKLLKFDAQTHTYTFKNKLALSASGVNNGSKANFELVRKESRAMLNEAARKGTQLHAFIYHYLTTGESDFSAFRDPAYFALGKTWLAGGATVKDRFAIIALEVPLVADLSMAKIALCGTLDAVLFDKQTQRYIILDWKSSSPQQRNYYILNYGIQLTIYKQLFVDNTTLTGQECDIGLAVVNQTGVKLIKL